MRRSSSLRTVVGCASVIAVSAASAVAQLLPPGGGGPPGVECYNNHCVNAIRGTFCVSCCTNHCDNGGTSFEDCSLCCGQTKKGKACELIN